MEYKHFKNNKILNENVNEKTEKNRQRNTLSHINFIQIDDEDDDNNNEEPKDININKSNYNNNNIFMKTCNENRRNTTFYRHNVINEEQKNFEYLLSRKKKNIDSIDNVNFSDFMKNDFFNMFNNNIISENKKTNKTINQINNNIDTSKNVIYNINYDEDKGEVINLSFDKKKNKKKKKTYPEVDIHMYNKKKMNPSYHNINEQNTYQTSDDNTYHNVYSDNCLINSNYTNLLKNESLKYKKGYKQNRQDESTGGEFDYNLEPSLYDDCDKLYKTSFLKNNKNIINKRNEEHKQDIYNNISDICKSYIKNFDYLNKRIFHNKSKIWKLSNKKVTIHGDSKKRIEQNNQEIEEQQRQQDGEKEEDNYNDYYYDDDDDDNYHIYDNYDDYLENDDYDNHNYFYHKNHDINKIEKVQNKNTCSDLINSTCINNTNMECHNKKDDNLKNMDSFLLYMKEKKIKKKKNINDNMENELSDTLLSHSKKHYKDVYDAHCDDIKFSFDEDYNILPKKDIYSDNSRKNLDKYPNNSSHNYINNISSEIIKYCKDNNITLKSDIKNVINHFNKKYANDTIANNNINNIFESMNLQRNNVDHVYDCSINNTTKNSNNVSNNNNNIIHITNDNENIQNNKNKQYVNSIVNIFSKRKNANEKKENVNEKNYISFNSNYKENINLRNNKIYELNNNDFSTNDYVNDINLNKQINNNLNKNDNMLIYNRKCNLDLTNESINMEYNLKKNNSISDLECKRNNNDNYKNKDICDDISEIYMNGYYDDIIKCYMDYTLEGMNDETHFYLCEFCKQNIFDMNNMIKNDKAKECMYSCNISCGRTFHKTCVSYINKNDNYICFFCIYDINFCTLCKEVVTNDSLLPCYYPLCSVSMHIKCVEKLIFFNSECLKQYVSIKLSRDVNIEQDKTQKSDSCGLIEQPLNIKKKIKRRHSYRKRRRRGTRKSQITTSNKKINKKELTSGDIINTDIMEQKNDKDGNKDNISHNNDNDDNKDNISHNNDNDDNKDNISHNNDNDDKNFKNYLLKEDLLTNELDHNHQILESNKEIQVENNVNMLEDPIYNKLFDKKEETGNNEDDENIMVLKKFICPLHICYVCKEFHINNIESSKKELNNNLFRCIKCFKSVHRKCMNQINNNNNNNDNINGNNNIYIISHKYKIMCCSNHMDDYKKEHMEYLTYIKQVNHICELVEPVHNNNNNNSNKLLSNKGFYDNENNILISKFHDNSSNELFKNQQNYIKAKGFNCLSYDHNDMNNVNNMNNTNKMNILNLKSCMVNDINTTEGKKKKSCESRGNNSINKKVVFDLTDELNEKLTTFDNIQNKIIYVDNKIERNDNICQKEDGSLNLGCMNISSVDKNNMRPNNHNNNNNNDDGENIISVEEEYNLKNRNLNKNNNTLTIKECTDSSINIDEFINKNQNEKNMSLDSNDALNLKRKRNVSHSYNDILDDTNILKDISTNKSYCVNVSKKKRNVSFNNKEELMRANELYVLNDNNIESNEKNKLNNNNKSKNIKYNNTVDRKNDKNKQINDTINKDLENINHNINNQQVLHNFVDDNMKSKLHMIQIKLRHILSIEKGLLSLKEINIDQMNDECKKHISILCTFRQDFINYVIFLFSKRSDQKTSNEPINHVDDKKEGNIYHIQRKQENINNNNENEEDQSKVDSINNEDQNKQDSLNNENQNKQDSLNNEDQNNQDNLNNVDQNKQDGLNNVDQNKQDSLNNVDQNKQDSLNNIDQNKQDSLISENQNKQDSSNNGHDMNQEELHETCKKNMIYNFLTNYDMKEKKYINKKDEDAIINVLSNDVVSIMQNELKISLYDFIMLKKKTVSINENKNNENVIQDEVGKFHCNDINKMKDNVNNDIISNDKYNNYDDDVLNGKKKKQSILDVSHTNVTSNRTIINNNICNNNSNMQIIEKEKVMNSNNTNYYDEKKREEYSGLFFKGKKKSFKNNKMDLKTFCSLTNNGYKIDLSVLKKYSSFLNFVYISKNTYLSDKNKNLLACKSDDYKCLCQGECNLYTCYNSLSNIQCSKSKCNLPEKIQDRKCFNRPFRKSLVKNLEIKKTEKTGYGVFCKRDIKNGELICEYVGEVLGKEEFEKRLKVYEEESKKTDMYNWYTIQINKDVYIDSAKKGSISRFINHSCSPNSVSQKWIVRGFYRIGIFALRDIPSGEEITYNYSYNFLFNNFECLCKSANCMNYHMLRKGENSEASHIIKENELLNNKIFNPVENFHNLHGKMQDWNIFIEEAHTRLLYEYNKINAFNLRLMECYSTWIFYDMNFKKNQFFALKSKPFNVSAEFWKILVSAFSDGEKNIINTFNLFLPSLIKIGQLRRIQQYSYILHNIIGLEHDMWNLIDKGFADDEVCRKCKSCGNLTMCDKCFQSYHQLCGNMHSKVYKNNELVLCRFCQKYDYKMQWIKENHGSKMKTCIEIRSKAFYKLNRDIMTLLEESVKYTKNQSLDSIHAHNIKAFKSKKLKLRKFQYKYVKI
ncbi:variant-silencing SET protein [Plasmodium gaboni]|uniref:Variant-silencing SET protein n=1 Tax=Plasmodium gaboni TaxID=647221 RepID=A0ABY1URM0_9APIC|nr:variant-silencing SET protein [Plasmodium gaboni]